MAYPLPYKDPDEVLDYDADWGPRMEEGDEILTSLAEVVDPVASSVTVESQDFFGTVQKVWLSGGTVGVKSLILCRITTRDGRTMDETLSIKIKSK